ncbi:hypothetical protein CR513_10589, partial [Mucuna pruriens]
MIDVASGGALMDKTLAATRHLISNMESNTQQFGIRGPSQSQMVNEIGAACNQRLENQMTELTSLTRQFDNQQYGRQPFRPGPHQGPYAAQRAGSVPNMPYRVASYQQPSPQYPAQAFPQQQQRSLTQGNSPSLEDLMKQLATSNLEFQQSMSSNNMQFQQNMTATIQDLKMQIGQLANTVSQLHSAGSSNLPSQTIPNTRGNASAVILRSGKELPQPAQHQMPKSAEDDYKAIANSQSHPEAAVPLPFPSWTISTRKPESDEKLLKMFRKVEINISLLNAIKQILKYAKFLKELCVHKRRKMKGSREFGGVVSTLIKNEGSTARISQVLPEKCRDPGIFSVPCTIGECTFADAMLDLGASINVMPASIYRSLNLGDLEPIGMTIQLANRSIVQPLGVLEDVLVQVSELIFPADFYVLDMEDETSGKESTLIMGRPFLMIARTKIDVHAGTLSMEFDDTLVQFNIFEAMKHPTEDHSLFGIDMIEELVEEYFQPNNCSEEIKDSTGSIINCLEADQDEVQQSLNSEDNYNDVADLAFEAELTELLDQIYQDMVYQFHAMLSVNTSQTLERIERIGYLSESFTTLGYFLPLVSHKGVLDPREVVP